LLELDRAFDAERVALLHAYAGSGKTSTAAEFARWYALTGGADGPILFTAFDTKRTLDQVVDQLGRRFEKELAEAGIQWAAIQDMETRRRVAMDLLSSANVFWVWDNVEPVSGFPAGAPSE